MPIKLPWWISGTAQKGKSGLNIISRVGEIKCRFALIASFGEYLWAINVFFVKKNG